jgi:hypothetical protein
MHAPHCTENKKKIYFIFLLPIAHASRAWCVCVRTPRARTHRHRTHTHTNRTRKYIHTYTHSTYTHTYTHTHIHTYTQDMQDLVHRLCLSPGIRQRLARKVSRDRQTWALHDVAAWYNSASFFLDFKAWIHTLDSYTHEFIHT